MTSASWDIDGPPSLNTSLSEAVVAFTRSRPVIIVDDAGPIRAELCCPGDDITTSTMAFLITETSGLVVATTPATSLDRLELPLMRYQPSSPAGRYCVAVDACAVKTTGISAIDRAITVRQLASPNASAADFCRPGHVIPAMAGGPFAAMQWTCYDAAHELSRTAGLSGVVACASMIDGVNSVGTQSILNLSAQYAIPIVHADELNDLVPIAGHAATERHRGHL